MKIGTLRLLRCPDCGSALSPRLREPAEGPDIESAILACECGEVPLVGGIPIFRREGRVDRMMQTVDTSMDRGPRVHQLLDLIRSGRAEDALMLLLATPPAWVRNGLQAIEALPAGRRGRLRRVLERAWIRRGRSKRPLFRLEEPRTTARDAFAYYYLKSARSEHYHHFFHRFAQPRHLSGLALASLLPVDGLPVVDVACGFGHTLHAWTADGAPGTFIGIDRNFFELYAARRWVAPRAEYVCASGDQTLPLAAGTVGGVYCSDAFHYFLHKVEAIGEFRRVLSRSGLLVLSRVGNACVEPREGYELAPAGYARLLEGMNFRIRSDRQLLERYLAGFGPALAEEQPAFDGVAEEKWLSLVAGAGTEAFRDHGPRAGWPHGAGKLRINPLYREVGRSPQGRVSFALELPSEWFVSENGHCRDYMPERLDVAREVLDDLHAGKRSDPVVELVRQCVVLGFPEAYF